MGQQNVSRDIAKQAIKFLDAHKLEATPANYSFAYLYLTGTTSAMHKAVDEITDGGFRLSQTEVDELVARAIGSGGTANSEADDMKALIRHQLLAVADLTNASLRNTSAFGRDLATGIEQAAAGADLLTLVCGMIERTAEVERKLAETCQETERLRHDLNSARDDASRDILTNLPNRRAVDGRIKVMLGEAKTLAVAFCDIDHFKSINDRFGHAVGDRVLKSVADTLAQTVDPHLVARYGGEEFVVFFPEMDGQAAFELIEKARKTLSERKMRVRETDEPIGAVTFSAGIATTDSDPEAAIREADLLLYDAKNSGRNRTVYRAGI